LRLVLCGSTVIWNISHMQQLEVTNGAVLGRNSERRVLLHSATLNRCSSRSPELCFRYAVFRDDSNEVISKCLRVRAWSPPCAKTAGTWCSFVRTLLTSSIRANLLWHFMCIEFLIGATIAWFYHEQAQSISFSPISRSPAMSLSFSIRHRGLPQPSV